MLETLTLQTAIEGYQRRHFKPSELLRSYLDRIQTLNKSLNAYLELRLESTTERAEALDKLLEEDISKYPLFGIPIAIKDNFLVSGWQTTAGSKILKNYRSPYTSTAVERLETAGAIVIGKTNLDEFAMGSSNENSAYGPVRNPWDLERVPGGSSGGSACAVSARLCLGALGTDTGGSIRQPAGLCGVVGIKPTYGRVSRYGVVAFGSSLDQVGPFGQTVWDAARILEVMSGYDRKDATSSRAVVPKYTESLNQFNPKQLRIGVAKAWMEEGIDPEIKNNFDLSLLNMTKLGAKIVDIELPHIHYSLSTYYIIAPSEASSNLARYDGAHYGHRCKDAKNGEELYSKSRGEGFGPEVKLRIMLGTYALSSGYYDAYYTKANQVRRLIQQDFESAFQKCDVIAAPTSPTSAFKLGDKVTDPLQMYLSDIFTLPANLAGIPGLSIPSGLDSKGLPIGLQLLGKWFDENALLQAAFAFEQTREPLSLPKILAGEGL